MRNIIMQSLPWYCVKRYGGYEEYHHAVSTLVLCKKCVVSFTPQPSDVFCTRQCCAHASIEPRILRRLRISRGLLLLGKSRLHSCRSILNMLKKWGEGIWTAFVWLKKGSSGGLLVTISLTNNRVLLVKNTSSFLTLRWLMSYIYGAPILDVSRSHTTTQHSR